MKLRSLFFFFCLFAGQYVSAQEEETAYVNLSSPYNSIYTFLDNLQDDTYLPEQSAKVFNTEDKALARRAAIKLKQVLDGQGLYIDLAEVPKERNYYDSALKRNRFILTEKYPDIYLEKQDDKWQFPAAVIPKVAEAHSQVFTFGTAFLLNWLPKLGTYQVAGFHLWQLIAILMLIIICFLLHKLLTYIFRNIVLGYLKRSKYSNLANRYVGPVVRPFSIFLIITLVAWFVPVLQLPILLSKYIVILLNVLGPVFLTIVAFRMVDLVAFYFRKLAEKTQSSLDDQLVPLITKAMRLFVVIIGIFYILLKLDVDVIPLLTGLSIGGLAFALAAQDTIKNFFGSVMIFVDKPFQIGDWITSGDIDGTVEEVGFRSTRVRTFRNSVVYVPNGNLADSTIDNHGLRVYRRFFTQLALTYDTPTAVIKVFTEGLKEIVLAHPETRKDYYEIHLNNMNSSSLDVMFYIFFKVPSWSDELRARQEIILSIIDLAKELGVNFAFPTQTLHMENFPGQESLSPGYGQEEELRQKMKSFAGRLQQGGGS